MLAVELVGFVGFSVGCKDDGPAAKYYTPGNGGSSAGAGALDCDVPDDLCDITDAECQQEILRVTACIRGDEVAKAPPMRVITQDQFRKELQAQVKDMGIMATVWDSGLQLLALEDEGTSSVEASIEESVQSIAAYYSDETKDVTIISDSGTGDDPATRMLVLSHELTHFLQDRVLDLGKQRDQLVKSTDSHVAYTSYVEGDAVVSSNFAISHWNQKDLASLDWESYFDRMDAAFHKQIAESSSPLFVAIQGLPYPIGGRYLARVWTSTDRKHVDELAADPPLHVTDWLREYGDDAPLPSRFEPTDCAPPLPPKGLAVYGVDELGPTGLFALLARDDGALSESDLELIDGLRGDAIATYATSSDMDAPLTPVAAAWRLRFASASQADQLTALAKDLGLAARTDGKEALITAHQAQAAAFDSTALVACPSESELMARSTNTMHAIPRFDSFWR